MKRFSRLKEKLDIFGSRPNGIYVEVRGRELLLAEGYCHIEEYTDTYVTLTSNRSKISVHGEALRLRHLSKERIAVEGRIDSFEFL